MSYDLGHARRPSDLIAVTGRARPFQHYTGKDLRVNVEVAELHHLNARALNQRAHCVHLRFEVSEPREDQIVEGHERPPVSCGGNGALHIGKTPSQRTVVPLIVHAARADQAHAERIHPCVAQGPYSLCVACISVDVDGAPVSARPHGAAGLGNDAPLICRLALAALPEADDGLGRLL